jgi:chorismate-pyruvate lyase
MILQTDLLRHESVRSLELASHPMGWIVASNSIYNREYADLGELARNGSSPTRKTPDRTRKCWR